MDYCGKCGAILEGFVDQEGIQRKRCTQCDWTWYNNPLAIVLVLGETRDGRILYTRKSSWPEGMWGLLAGIVESGETPEETVIREVLEEAGMRAIEPLYVGSQTLPGQLLLCFFARLEGDRAVAGSDADAVLLEKPDPKRIPQGAPARQFVEQFLAGGFPTRGVDA